MGWKEASGWRYGREIQRRDPSEAHDPESKCLIYLDNYFQLLIYIYIYTCV